MYDVRKIAAEDPKQDLKFILSEGKKGTNEIGFLPTEALERYIEKGWINLCENNGDRIGFSVLQWSASTGRILQLWLIADARRAAAGLALLAVAKHKAAALFTQRLSCWCAEDLEANAFWQAVGFDATGTRKGGEARKRKQIKYEFDALPLLWPQRAEADSQETVRRVLPVLQRTSVPYHKAKRKDEGPPDRRVRRSLFDQQ